MKYKTKGVRCLGVDPGIAHTGYAVVQKTVADYRLVTSDLVRTASSDTLGQRYLKLYQSLCDVIATQTPDLIAVEKVFFGKNVSSAMTTAGVIGIVHFIAAQSSIEVVELTPQAVKSAVGIKGGSSKADVQRMVRCLLRVSKLNNHVADAAAAGVGGCLSGVC